MNDVEFQLIDCNNINISTPNSGKTYLQYINGSIIRKGLSNIRRYEIKYSQNCCTETTIPIPVRYIFTEEISDCSFSVAPNPGNIVNYNLNLLGMNGLFLSKLEMSFDNLTYVNTVFTLVNGGINYGLSFDYSTTFTPLTYYLRLTTVDNFVYTILLSIEPTGLTPCDNVIHNIISVTYPVLDNRIYIYPNVGTIAPNLPNTLSLNQLFYPTTPPISNNTFQSGVIQIVICEYSLSNPNTSSSLISNCIQNNYFIDCNLICNVINKLIDCPNSNLMIYYNALTYSNNCNTSYKDKCFLYESFYNKLTMLDCEDPFDDCGKSNVKYSNKPNVRYTSVSPCGCN